MSLHDIILDGLLDIFDVIKDTHCVSIRISINRICISGPTDFAKRCELLPASNQTAASGNAVTFTRHLGPFDDGLQRMSDALVS